MEISRRGNDDERRRGHLEVVEEGRRRGGKRSLLELKVKKERKGSDSTKSGKLEDKKGEVRLGARYLPPKGSY